MAWDAQAVPEQLIYKVAAHIRALLLYNRPRPARAAREPDGLIVKLRPGLSCHRPTRRHTIVPSDSVPGPGDAKASDNPSVTDRLIPITVMPVVTAMVVSARPGSTHRAVTAVNGRQRNHPSPSQSASG